MSLKRIGREQALDAIKEGRPVYQVQEVHPYSLYSVTDLIAMEFAVEDLPEQTEGDSEVPGGEEASSRGGGKTSKNSVTVTRRRSLDWGKIKALHDAGWPNAKIADEMHCSVGTVATGLSKMRKGGSDGKEETGEADTCAENTDQ